MSYKKRLQEIEEVKFELKNKDYNHLNYTLPFEQKFPKRVGFALPEVGKYGGISTIAVANFLLSLPSDTRIVEIARDYSRQATCILLESEEFEEMEQGMVMPMVEVIWTAEYPYYKYYSEA